MSSNTFLSEFRKELLKLKKRQAYTDQDQLNARTLIKEFLSFCFDEGIVETFDFSRVKDIIKECNRDNFD